MQLFHTLFLWLSLKLSTKVTDRPSKAVVTKETRTMENLALVLEIGSLQVYSAEMKDEHTQAAATQYFWRDAGSPQGYGPFASVLSCMKHYAWLIKQAKGAGSIEIEAAGGELIRVDFQNKCKVEQ